MTNEPTAGEIITAWRESGGDIEDLQERAETAVNDPNEYTKRYGSGSSSGNITQYVDLAPPPPPVSELAPPAPKRGAVVEKRSSPIYSSVKTRERTGLFNEMTQEKNRGVSKAENIQKSLIGETARQGREVTQEEVKKYEALKTASEVSLLAIPFIGASSGLALAATGTAVNLGGKIVSKAPNFIKTGANVFNQASKTQIGGLAGQAVRSGSIALGFAEGAPLVADMTASQEQKAAIKGANIDAAIKAGFEAQQEEAKKGAVYKQIGEEISPFFGNSKSYEAGARQELKKQGLTGDQLNNAVQYALNQRTARGTGEALGLLEFSRGAESIGRKGVTESVKAFSQAVSKKEAGKKLFQIGGAKIGAAGFIEGAGQELVQQRSRERDLNIQEIGGMGALGAGTATAIGGGILYTKFTKPKVSAAIELGANILDPLEKPGDITQDIVETAGRRLGVDFPTPKIVTPGVKVDQLIGIGTEASKPSASTSKPGSFSIIPDPDSFSIIPDITPDGGKGKGKPFVPVPITPTPITPSPLVPTAVSLPEPDYRINTNINVNTNTNIPALSFAPVPVVTPMARIPPPVPLTLPGKGFGGFGAFGRTGRKVIDEYGFSQQLVSSALGFSLGNGQGKDKKKKKGKKETKKVNPLLRGLL